MARSFLLTFGSPLPYAISVEESADGATGWAESDNVLYSALTVLGGGSFRLDAANADTAKYVRLVPQDSGATPLTATPNRIYSPQASTPGVVTVTVDTVDLGLGALSGLEFSSVADPYNTSSGSLAVKGTSATTDANGHAELSIMADCGTVTVKLKKPDGQILSGDLVTTGLGGATVGFETLVS